MAAPFMIIMDFVLSMKSKSSQNIDIVLSMKSKSSRNIDIVLSMKSKSSRNIDFVLSMKSKSSQNIDMLQFLGGHRLSCEEDSVFEIEALFVASVHAIIWLLSWLHNLNIIELINRIHPVTCNEGAVAE